ncbi:hypothetical protein TruAng_003953 [Truncatella angustata]|nr:hypothetical protein TruAng_003953 [Truncatella angustata]
MDHNERQQDYGSNTNGHGNVSMAMTSKYLKSKMKKKLAKEQTSNYRASPDKVYIYVIAPGSQYTMFLSRQTISAASPEYLKDVLADGRETLIFCMDIASEMEAVKEALNYMFDSRGKVQTSSSFSEYRLKSPHQGPTQKWKFRDELVDSLEKSLGTLEDYATLYLVHYTFGFPKGMRNAQASLRKVLQVMELLLTKEAEQITNHDCGTIENRMHNLFERLGTPISIIYQVVGCINIDCKCSADDTHRVSNLNGLQRTKCCGYRKGEPEEITDGRRAILNIVRMFQKALQIIKQQHPNFCFESRSIWWQDAVTSNRKIPRIASNYIAPQTNLLLHKSERPLAIGSYPVFAPSGYCFFGNPGHKTQLMVFHAVKGNDNSVIEDSGRAENSETTKCSDSTKDSDNTQYCECSKDSDNTQYCECSKDSGSEKDDESSESFKVKD